LNDKRKRVEWDRWPSAKRDKLRKLYLKLRTYTATSKAFKCSTRTVKRYAEVYGWRDDLAEQDRQVQEAQNKEAVEERLDSLDVVDETILKLQRDYDNAEPGNKPAIASSIDKLIGKRELLLGRPTERVEETLLDHLEKQYNAHLKEEAEEAKRRKALKKESK